MILLHIIFWISVGLLVHTAVIYYLLLKVFKQNDYKKNDTYFPGITLIISTYNEEKCISGKLLNTLESETIKVLEWFRKNEMKPNQIVQ